MIYCREHIPPRGLPLQELHVLRPVPRKVGVIVFAVLDHPIRRRALVEAVGVQLPYKRAEVGVGKISAESPTYRE
eukprot:scaffold748_cov251-Pinguiococcus_pyrenoidosus.AAC.3